MDKMLYPSPIQLSHVYGPIAHGVLQGGPKSEWRISKGKGAYSSSYSIVLKFTSELRDATCQWDHTVLSATRQRWPPRLHPNQAGRYSIYRPRKDERLSWPSWLVTCRNGLPVHRPSPSLVLTGSDVAQLYVDRDKRITTKPNRQT